MTKSWLLPLIVAVGLAPGTLPAEGCTQSEPIKGGGGDCATGSVARKEGALFRYQDKYIRLADLDLNTRQALYELDSKYYEDRERVLDNALWQLYLDHEAGRQQKSREQLLREWINAPVPTEAEIRAFYDANSARINVPYDSIKGQIGRYLQEQQMLAQRDLLVADLKQSDVYQPLLQRPSPPVAVIDTDGFPSKGDALAPVEIVEFADYQCPHCKTASTIVNGLTSRFGDKLRVVFMDFPINRSGVSRRVAEGAVCAGEQGKFWPFHDEAFSRQSGLNKDSPFAIAKLLGLDEASFAQCLEGDQPRQKIARAESEAHRLGLNSTPTFFVNGVRVQVHDDMERALIEAIEAALSQNDS